MVSILQSYVKSKDAEREEIKKKLAKFLKEGGMILPAPENKEPEFKKKIKDIYFSKKGK